MNRKILIVALACVAFSSSAFAQGGEGSRRSRWRSSGRRRRLVGGQCRHGVGRKRGRDGCGGQLCELVNFQFQSAAGDAKSSDELFQSERTERRDIEHSSIPGSIES
ncbi:hypothetical protein ACQ86E_09605 [Bradyrhizobium betae]|uniref:hypothetical protein n=1 Tax=Bradyrhizobium betae TaxID=244734 RepID=UPI003D67B7CB